MRRFKIEVEKLNGYCDLGYKEGDVFYSEGMNTPCNGFCGGAFMILYPMQVALFSGSKFGFEKNPKCKTGLACPDRGKVVFSIELLDE